MDWLEKCLNGSSNQRRTPNVIKVCLQELNQVDYLAVAMDLLQVLTDEQCKRIQVALDNPKTKNNLAKLVKVVVRFVAEGALRVVVPVLHSLMFNIRTKATGMVSSSPLHDIFGVTEEGLCDTLQQKLDQLLSEDTKESSASPEMTKLIVEEAVHQIDAAMKVAIEEATEELSSPLFFAAKNAATEQAVEEISHVITERLNALITGQAPVKLSHDSPKQDELEAHMKSLIREIMVKMTASPQVLDDSDGEEWETDTSEHKPDQDVFSRFHGWLKELFSTPSPLKDKDEMDGDGCRCENTHVIPETSMPLGSPLETSTIVEDTVIDDSGLAVDAIVKTAESEEDGLKLSAADALAATYSRLHRLFASRKIQQCSRELSDKIYALFSEFGEVPSATSICPLSAAAYREDMERQCLTAEVLYLFAEETVKQLLAECLFPTLEESLSAPSTPDSPSPDIIYVQFLDALTKASERVKDLERESPSSAEVSPSPDAQFEETPGSQAADHNVVADGLNWLSGFARKLMGKISTDARKITSTSDIPQTSKELIQRAISQSTIAMSQQDLRIRDTLTEIRDESISGGGSEKAQLAMGQTTEQRPRPGHGKRGLKRFSVVVNKRRVVINMQRLRKNKQRITNRATSVSRNEAILKNPDTMMLASVSPVDDGEEEMHKRTFFSRVLIHFKGLSED